MLTIRREQMTVLETHSAERFRESLRRQVRREFREETKAMDDAQLLRLVDQGLQRGRAYGLTSERSLTLFTDLLFAHSPAFDDAPDMRWAKRILLDKELDGEGKMNLIYKQLAAQQAPQELT